MASTDHVLALLAHPVRLPIMLLLEEKPSTITQIARALRGKGVEVSFDNVVYAVRALHRGGLIVVAGTQRRGRRVEGRTFRPATSGWHQLRDLLEQLAPPTGQDA